MSRVSSEVAALKAAFEGAGATWQRLQALQERVDRLDPLASPGQQDLDELGRAATAHAVSAQALRGLVVQLLERQKSLT